MRCAVIGAGHLGKWHAQKYHALPECELAAVVDVDAARAGDIAAPLGARALTDYHELLGTVDAVSIAVPTCHHHAIAREFLAADTHVLVEKPITVTVAEADELIALADQRGLVLRWAIWSASTQRCEHWSSLRVHVSSRHIGWHPSTGAVPMWMSCWI
jgi:predicted dehydrogenase